MITVDFHAASSCDVMASPMQSKPLMSTWITRCLDIGADFLFAYETPKIINIRSKKIGAIHRLVQAAIVAYVIGYVFIWSKGYQEVDHVESSVVTKVKGLIRTAPPYPLNTHIWDSIDFVIPPQENNAFFIATNLIAAPDQVQADCPEDGNVNSPNVRCRVDAECPAGTAVINGNGFRTGRCSNGTCEISAWCPTEQDILPHPPNLAGSENFTVLVKNHIMFPKFKLKRRNILTSLNASYLATCRFHPVTDKYCPIFVMKDIVQNAGEDYTEMSSRGGVMGFIIEWNCDLDFSSEYCLPEYKFRRMDNKEDTLAKGWNFRYAHYWTDEYGQGRRTMLKAYGIRVVFNVYGSAGRFSAVVFAMNLGSGIGLLGMATLLCDFILLHCLKNKNKFKKHKFIRLESNFLKRNPRDPAHENGKPNNWRKEQVYRKPKNTNIDMRNTSAFMQTSLDDSNGLDPYIRAGDSFPCKEYTLSLR
ncbi:P2X purinoceptor 4-like [Paramacrobiotus metropolitanus]|uniref:P2X purinoceptor 4-like n=1 Tax=Paramacrobiotus metropolitanus TaxID=2943436 RepID=UPI002446240D|nr:P2X purinoceptor 4-like [Paramacrobiotus metropolitanus]